MYTGCRICAHVINKKSWKDLVGAVCVCSVKGPRVATFITHSGASIYFGCDMLPSDLTTPKKKEQNLENERNQAHFIRHQNR